MKNKLKFSIITVVYNAKEILKKTIESIQNQTYRDFECVIVDGGSTDGTLEYIESLSFDNLNYISEKDNGIYDAMNKGINLSNGEYLIFLNAGDNFTSKNILQIIYDRSKQDNPKIIYGGANVYSEEGKFLSTLKALSFTKSNLNKYATRTVCHQSIFVHCNSIKMYSDKYRLKGELNWYYDLIENIEEKYIVKIDEVICDYYLGGTGDNYFWENYFERIKVTKEHNSFFKFIVLTPFFLIPLIFRLRRKIFGK